MIKIYKLIHNAQIVYVGQTKLKYLSMRKASGYGNTIPFFKECKIELIEETTDISRERYWIERLNIEGHPLLNKLKGDGLNKLEYDKEYSREYRRKNKEKKREYHREYYKKKKLEKNNLLTP
jgi:hypothetical protein